jgi:pimeloyl-ACP methyl ester carboxylesterase
MLHYRSVGEGRPLVIVHGLFGSGDNWLTLAGKFPGWKVYLPDLRNHGASPWFDSFTLSDLASDLGEFARALDLGPCPWIGHSLGGKAVMELALSSPERVLAIAVLDMAPRASEARYQGFVPTLRAVDLNRITSRTEAQALLAAEIPDRATLQFLLKSLVLDHSHPGRLRWLLNLESLDRHYPEIWKAVDGNRSWPGPALFLKGGASDFFRAEDEELARRLFPSARFETVAGAGHWLHAEKPAEVLAALNGWLKDAP